MANTDIYRLCRGVFHALSAKEKNDLLITWGDGLGDSLLLTAVAHEWNLRTGRKVAVYTQFPELYQENPTIISYPYLGNLIFPFKSRLLKKIQFPIYAPWNPKTDSSIPPDKHIIAKMCEAVGIRNRIRLRPYLYFSEKEMEASVTHNNNTILIQSSGLSARLSMKNKEWFPLRFQEIADALGKEFHVIQIGSLQDPCLNGVIDLRGKTTVRQLASLMHRSRLFIGLVGFLMHLARASECPSVIIYGGREHPFQSGYICNENLASYISCSPCWLWNRCDYNKKCMSNITTQDAIEACRRLLDRNPKHLEDEYLII